MKKAEIEKTENNPVILFVRNQVEQGQETIEKLRTQVTGLLEKVAETANLDLDAAKTWVERLTKEFASSRADFEKKLSATVTEAINRVGLATRQQIDELAHRVEMLSKRVETASKDRTPPVVKKNTAKAKKRIAVAQA